MYFHAAGQSHSGRTNVETLTGCVVDSVNKTDRRHSKHRRRLAGSLAPPSIHSIRNQDAPSTNHELRGSADSYIAIVNGYNQIYEAIGRFLCVRGVFLLLFDLFNGVRRVLLCLHVPGFGFSGWLL